MVISMSGSERSGVPPEGYRLYDEETGKYWCPFCGSRILRVGDYAECTDCGERFRRGSA